MTRNMKGKSSSELESTSSAKPAYYCELEEQSGYPQVVVAWWLPKNLAVTGKLVMHLHNRFWKRFKVLRVSDPPHFNSVKEVDNG